MLITARRISYRLAALGVLAWVAVPPCARAASPQPLRLSYSAHAGCPDAAQFRESVLKRVKRPTSFDGESPSQYFEVKLVKDASGFEGELVVREARASKAASTRRFHTETCEQAVQALAIVAALAADSNAQS